MNRSTLVAIGFTGALALLAAPASAQHRRNGGERHDTAAPRTESRGERPREQAQAQPRQREEQRAAPRQEQRAAPRQEQRAAPRQEQRAAPRRYDNRRNGGSYYSGRYYGQRYAGPRFSSAPRRFYRPYYIFRPRFSIGFGISAGYPVTYYDPYYSPYDSYPYASVAPGGPGYPPQGSFNVQPNQPNQPNQANMGGLSFEITPDTAEVYVDGNYAGEVGQFTSGSQPLGLPAGRHHIEVREPGFDVTSFDVDIIAGQVIPYQGQLQQ
jgi:hypothetical protein